MEFELISDYQPTGDQPEAIAQLTEGILQGVPAQTLLGVTGSGKTFTIANVIKNINKPTLILSHNKTLAAQLYGLGSQYGVTLPFSRKHESEADYMGLVLMTIAGYNPDVAIGFWQKMSADGGSVPEFMSTHPSDATRIKDIRKELPLIKKKYQQTKNVQKNVTPKAAYEWHFKTK